MKVFPAWPALLAWLGGCALYNDVPAEHTLDPEQPLVVVVEPAPMRNIPETEADRLGRLVASNLSAAKAATVVSAVPLMDIRGTDPQAYRQMTIAEKAAACGARQVLLIRLIQWDRTPIIGGDESVRVVASVLVLDGETGAVRWAPQASGRTVTYATADRPVSSNADSTPLAQAMNADPTAELASRISTLFHKTYKNE